MNLYSFIQESESNEPNVLGLINVSVCSQYVTRIIQPAYSCLYQGQLVKPAFFLLLLFPFSEFLLRFSFVSVDTRNGCAAGTRERSGLRTGKSKIF